MTTTPNDYRCDVSLIKNVAAHITGATIATQSAYAELGTAQSCFNDSEKALKYIGGNSTRVTLNDLQRAARQATIAGSTARSAQRDLGRADENLRKYLRLCVAFAPPRDRGQIFCEWRALTDSAHDIRMVHLPADHVVEKLHALAEDLYEIILTFTGSLNRQNELPPPQSSQPGSQQQHCFLQVQTTPPTADLGLTPTPDQVIGQIAYHITWITILCVAKTAQVITERKRDEP